MDYVAGYTVAHDVSARDWQMERNGKQWLLGKSFDTFCPLGPALVTKDDLPGKILCVYPSRKLIFPLFRSPLKHCFKWCKFPLEKICIARRHNFWK